MSATNYQGGRTQRTTNQMEFFFDLINKMTSSEGIGWINDSDVISNAIKTDLSYDTLSALAAMYGQGASFYTALMPGSQYTVNNVVCFSPNSKAWEQMRGRFMNGEDVNTSIDTSGIDKSKLSIVVYNGTGSDGFAAQAAQVRRKRGRRKCPSRGRARSRRLETQSRAGQKAAGQARNSAACFPR